MRGGWDLDALEKFFRRRRRRRRRRRPRPLLFRQFLEKVVIWALLGPFICWALLGPFICWALFTAPVDYIPEIECTKMKCPQAFHFCAFDFLNWGCNRSDSNRSDS